jgi:hypothetical protein
MEAPSLGPLTVERRDDPEELSRSSSVRHLGVSVIVPG